MKPVHLILPALFFAAAAPANGCTETPDDFPDCVGPGSYCPSDAGADALDAPADVGTPATSDGGLDAMNAADGAATSPDAATVSVDAAIGD